MSEEYRHQCEVRYILALRAKNEQRAKAYLAKVGERRGEAARVRLNNDCIEQWKQGNRGMKGDWR